MRTGFTENGWSDYQYWIKNDKAIIKRINLLINECLRTQFEGIGKPEALKHQLAGYWSRRITEEHRLVYAVEDEQIVILAARHHY
ncbi:Txe/YoeB family addiction module toxin [Arthrobacter sp. alpha11c]